MKRLRKLFGAAIASGCFALLGCGGDGGAMTGQDGGTPPEAVDAARSPDVAGARPEVETDDLVGGTPGNFGTDTENTPGATGGMPGSSITSSEVDGNTAQPATN